MSSASGASGGAAAGVGVTAQLGRGFAAAEAAIGTGAGFAVTGGRTGARTAGFAVTGGRTGARTAGFAVTGGRTGARTAGFAVTGGRTGARTAGFAGFLMGSFVTARATVLAIGSGLDQLGR